VLLFAEIGFLAGFIVLLVLLKITVGHSDRG
jgi:hypothetical protein